MKPPGILPFPCALRTTGVLLLACSSALGQDAAPVRPPLRFTGRILDERGSPVADAGFVVGLNDRLVTASALASPMARTGADGRFDFAAPPPPADSQAVHSVLVAAPGKSSVRWANLHWPAPGDGPQPQAWSSAQKLEFGDVVLPDGVTVKGKLRTTGGKPLSGARIRVADLVSLRTSQSRLSASYAYSDAEGAFVVPCVPAAALHVCVDADGHYHKTVSPALARQPLILELAASGFVEGKVKGSDGKPVRAYVKMAYEVEHYEQAAETAGDGSFRLTVRFPCRYRVHVTPLGSDGPSAQSDVLEGPRAGVELALAAAPPPPERLSVVAVDSRSGARVERFRAAAAWDAGENGLDAMFAAIARASDRNGTATLDLPAERQSAGVVRVVAPGFAPARQALELKEGEEHKVEVRLEPESVLEGRVLDERTRAPVPGARVLAHHVREEEAGAEQEPPPAETGPETGPDGVFRLSGLGPGKYQVSAGHAQRPEGKKVRVELKQGETRRGFELELPAGVVFSGRFVGAKVGRGWRARLDLESRPPPFEFAGIDMYSMYSEEQVSHQGAVDVLEDGSFRFEGRGRGHYALVLLLPSHPRSGPMIEVLVERLRIRRSDLARECDISEDLPGALRGKVTCSGAQPTPGRLIVTAEPGEGRHAFGPSQVLVGRRGLVRDDGSFEIVVPPGDYRLRVVDLETGILLFHDKRKIEVASGAPSERDLAFEVAEVKVRLEPEEGVRWTAARLFVETSTKADDGSDAPWAGMMLGGSLASSPGIDLGEHPSDVSFFTPPGDTKLSVRSGIERIAPGSSGEPIPPLAEAEVKAEMGSVKTVKVKVAPPPEILKEDGEKKE